MDGSTTMDETTVTEMSETELIEAYRGFVEKIVNKIWEAGECHRLSKGDLRSYGYRGLLEARRKFDGEREIEFSTYAYRRVRGEILDEMRRFRRAPRGRKTRERDDLGPRAANRTSRALREASDEISLRGEVASNPPDVAVSTFLMTPSAIEGLKFGVDGAQRDDLLREERLEAVRDALEELSEMERTVVRLHHFEEQPLSRIAEALDCSKGWVSRLHRRAVDELREIITGGDATDDATANVVEIADPDDTRERAA